MPRALIVCEPPGGGAAENAVTLAERLPEHGWEVEYAGPPGLRGLDRLDAAGVAFHELALAPGYGNPGRDRVALRALSKLLADGDFDLVHLHSSKAGVLGRLAARRRGVPVVFSPHSPSFVGDFGARRRLAAVAIERALGPLTAAMLCVCEFERRQVLEHRLVPAARVHVVHNGSPPCDPATDPDPALAALGAGGPVAASLCELREQKSVDVLVDAAPVVLAAVPDARIAIVGDGPLRGELESRAAALGLDSEERFAFIGFEAPSVRWLKASDVYVLPSAWEAFPIGVLEAQACGVPQVATDVGGTGEAVVPETGVLVPRRDPAALADALVALLSDPDRRAALSSASRERHGARFGVPAMVAGTAAVYEAVLGA